METCANYEVLIKLENYTNEGFVIQIVSY